MAYYDFLNYIFAPLLKLPVILTVLIIAFLVSVLIIVITKYMTDQALMKRLKEQIKEYQKQIKELRGDPAKAMEVQKKAMEVNMQYMINSLKPTLITFIPIILVFGWMNATFAFESIHPGETFSVTAFMNKNAEGFVNVSTTEGLEVVGDHQKEIEDSQVTFKFKGQEGEHLMEFLFDGESQQKSVLITDEQKYEKQDEKTNGDIELIRINYNKLVVVQTGYKDWLGWLGTYIILSIIFTMTFRKIFKIY